MKTMTCRQLGGACDHPFHANTFEEIAEMSRKHGMEMYEKGDAPHLQAMQTMRAMMQSPDALQQWMEEKRAEFDGLPDDSA